MPVVVLVSHRRWTICPHCYWRRPRCQCHASPRVGAQVAHSLHQRIGRIGDVGGVVGGEEYIGRVVGTVPAGQPPSLQVPSVRPGEAPHYHHSAPVLVVGKHVTHRDGVVPNVIGEREHDVGTVVVVAEWACR